MLTSIELIFTLSPVSMNSTVDRPIDPIIYLFHKRGLWARYFEEVNVELYGLQTGLIRKNVV